MKRAAFTLIELSIVLVIIGLVLGGVLIGRDLIESATLRRQISQYEQLQLAANSFEGKYKCLPGDCAQAGDFGLGDDGDGDGAVSQCVVVEEPSLFIQHLVAAQLINGDGQDDNRNLPSHYPPARLRIAEHAEGGPPCRHVANYMALTCYENNCAPSGLPTMGEMGVSVTPGVAWRIDNKLDDGDPLEGRVLAVQGWVDFMGLSTMAPDDGLYPIYGALGASSNVCIDDSTTPALYNIALQAKTCQPIVRFR